MLNSKSIKYLNQILKIIILLVSILKTIKLFKILTSKVFRFDKNRVFGGDDNKIANKIVKISLSLENQNIL